MVGSLELQVVWSDRYFEMTEALLLQREEGVFSWPNCSSNPPFFFSCLSSSLGALYVSRWNLKNPHYLDNIGVHKLILWVWVCEVQNERFGMKGGSD